MSNLTNEYGQPIGPAVTGWTPPARPARQTMEGAYCTVEPFDMDSHVPDLFDALCAIEPDCTYLPYGPFADLTAFREWAQERCLGDDPLFYTVRDSETGKAGGVASLMRITPQSGTIEVGHIHFGPTLKGTRAATEAMFLLMEYAFSLGYRRYEWKCDALNAPSRNAALRLGFTFEGTFRQGTVYKGRNRDTDWFSITDAEWPRLQEGFRRWLDPGPYPMDSRLPDGQDAQDGRGCGTHRASCASSNVYQAPGTSSSDRSSPLRTSAMQPTTTALICCSWRTFACG